MGVGGYKPYGFYIPTPNHLGKNEVFGKCSKKMKGNFTNISVTPYELCAYNYNWTNHYGAILGGLIASFQNRKA
jgi:hypothetical protein